MSTIKDEIYEFLDQNYVTYLNSNSQERKEIRDIVKKHHTSGESPNFLVLFLIGYVQRAAEKIAIRHDRKITFLIRTVFTKEMPLKTEK
jgi:hypothetical protein